MKWVGQHTVSGKLKSLSSVVTGASKTSSQLRSGSDKVAVNMSKATGTLNVQDTVVYLLPNDFIVNDASFIRGYNIAADDAGSDYGLTFQDSGIQAWSWYQVPRGFQLTDIHVYASVSTGTNGSVYQLNPQNGTRGSALASGVWGTNRTLTAAIANHDERAALIVLEPDAATDIVYSVKLTLATI